MPEDREPNAPDMPHADTRGTFRQSSPQASDCENRMSINSARRSRSDCGGRWLPSAWFLCCRRPARARRWLDGGARCHHAPTCGSADLLDDTFLAHREDGRHDDPQLAVRFAGHPRLRLPQHVQPWLRPAEVARPPRVFRPGHRSQSDATASRVPQQRGEGYDAPDGSVGHRDGRAALGRTGAGRASLAFRARVPRLRHLALEEAGAEPDVVPLPRPFARLLHAAGGSGPRAPLVLRLPPRVHDRQVLRLRRPSQAGIAAPRTPAHSVHRRICSRAARSPSSLAHRQPPRKEPADHRLRRFVCQGED
eukprot:scaffold7131_cov131-Isochrysis_galbana.AAC.6